jgi:hypothetical protein
VKDESFDHVYEDWNSDDDDSVICPECGAEVLLELNNDRCPECGHWFLEADRAMWRQAGGGLPLVYKLAAVLLIIAMLLPVLLLLL